MLEYLRSFFDLIYPPFCSCGAYGDILCERCIASFSYVDEGSSCLLCGRELPLKGICGSCLSERPIFEKALFGFYFEGSLREAIHSFKFRGNKEIGRRLVRMLEKKILNFTSVDAIIPIPLTEKRLRERGFNQSFIIAEEISKIIRKPVLYDLLIKIKETKDQYSLGREERKKNIKGAFLARDGQRIKGKSVLLVDDLYTTGATAKEAGRVLLGEKPKTLSFFALARAR